jgi:predicted RNA-binding Zn ribbon-like protein
MNTMFIDFVNSRWDAEHGKGGDFLLDPTRFNALLKRWGLPPRTALTTEQSRELVALRGLLTDAVLAITKGRTPAAETLAQLNSHLSAAVVHYVLEPTATGCQAALRPTSETDGLPSALVRSFAQFTMDHDLTRLRICANPDCHWVFYDESRNASRRFCANDCSSLIRVRRYRAKNR